MKNNIYIYFQYLIIIALLVILFAISSNFFKIGNINNIADLSLMLVLSLIIYFVIMLNFEYKAILKENEQKNE